MPKLSVFQTILLSAFGALAVSGVLIFALVIGSGSGTNIGPVMIWGTFDENTFRKIIRESAEQDGRLLSVTYEQKEEDKFANALRRLFRYTIPQYVHRSRQSVSRGGGGLGHSSAGRPSCSLLESRHARLRWFCKSSSLLGRALRNGPEYNEKE